MRRPTPERVLLLAIVVVGLALRVVPVWFGLPDVRARPDEETTIGIASAILGGDPNPHFFNWPTLTMYSFAGVFAAASFVARIGARAIRPDQCYVLARASIAFAGTTTIVVLWRLARRIGGSSMGLAAAWLLAVAILHVRDSHFATTDVLMTLFVTAALALLVRAAEPGRAASTDVRLWALAGAFGGFAAAAKYNGAVILIAIAAAQFVRVKEAADRRSAAVWLPGAASLAAFATAFVAGSPFVLLDYASFHRDIAFESSHLEAGHGGILLGRGWSYHLVRTLPYGLGIPVFVMAVAGAGILAVRRPRAAVVLGAFAAAYYAGIGSGHTVFFRYAMPLVPLACLAAAEGIRACGVWLADRAKWPHGASMAIVCALVSAPSLINAVWMDAALARTDTRHLASVWLQSHVKPTESVGDADAVYARAPNMPGHHWTYDERTQSFDVPDGAIPDWLVLYDSPLRTYAHIPAALRTLASTRYDLAFEASATHGAASSAVYDLQDAFFLPISGFSTVDRPGPTILIYRRARP